MLLIGTGLLRNAQSLVSDVEEHGIEERHINIVSHAAQQEDKIIG